MSGMPGRRRCEPGSERKNAALSTLLIDYFDAATDAATAAAASILRLYNRKATHGSQNHEIFRTAHEGT